MEPDKLSFACLLREIFGFGCEIDDSWEEKGEIVVTSSHGCHFSPETFIELTRRIDIFSIRIDIEDNKICIKIDKPLDPDSPWNEFL